MLWVLVTVPVLAVWTMAVGLPSIFWGIVDRRGGVSRRLAGCWGRGLLRALRVRVVVGGVENVPAGPALYAANHASAIDIPILFGYLPVDFRIIHKRSLYFVPVMGLYLYTGGHIAIDREHPFRARKSLEETARRMREGTSVLSFPEGTRSPDSGVRAFKRGSFVLAMEAEVPVVPVTLSGVKQVIPHGLLTLRPGTVHLTIHPALATAGRPAEQAAELAEEVRRVVAEGCQVA